MRKSLLSILFASLFVHSQAQVTFQDAYDQFKQQAKWEYENPSHCFAAGFLCSWGDDAALISE